MSLSYDKAKNRHEGNGDSFWASYSDLYTLLAVLFLMLYIVANLRSGTASLQNRVEYQRLAMESEDLRQQNKVYDALKTEYLAKQASESENQVYQDLMEKLTLLKGQAKDEKESLAKQAAENEEKELALNHYQQIIRNIINANLVSKAKLITRDEVIDKKREEIAEKEQVISQSNEEIREIRENLQDQIQKLEKSEKTRKISKAKMQKEVARLKAQSEEKIADLTAQSEAAEQQLASVAKELSTTKTDLKATSAKLEEESIQRAKLGAELEAARAQFEDETEQLKGDYEAKAAAAEAAFKSELENEKLTGAERAAKEKAFADQAKKDKAEMEGKLAALGDKMGQTEKELQAAQEGLQKAEAANDKYKEYVAALEQQKAGLAGDLAQAKQQLDDRKKVSETIKKELRKAGLNADVDPRTGEVTIAFGQEYFDTGRADLKPGMEKTLKKFVPLYAKSLFKDPKISERISSIDLIGFASPTYKGKYVDPSSMADEHRQAVNYNLDLSYQRARSIFGYIFDTKKMKFEDQKRLLGMVKVSGRSFLHDAVKGRDVESGISVKEFCAKFDCMKEQKVIIKFNMKD